MDIIIENCSSPGAHFSKNTNEVLLKIYEWINKNNKPELPFIEFRRRLENEEKINDNNARNIFPLIKNYGFVNYEKGVSIQYKYFFTNVGLAYCKALEAIKKISNDSEDIPDIPDEFNITITSDEYNALLYARKKLKSLS